MKKNHFTFEALVTSIQQVNEQLAVQASKAVNVRLTLRNWMIGFYIAEFELHGEDRAKYGDKLFSILGERLTNLRISNCNRRQLYRYLRFYQLYPTIVRTLSPQLTSSTDDPQIHSTLARDLSSPQLPDLIQSVSWSHHYTIVARVDRADERYFYLAMSVRERWSFRELRRQIDSDLFTR